MLLMATTIMAAAIGALPIPLSHHGQIRVPGPAQPTLEVALEHASVSKPVRRNRAVASATSTPSARDGRLRIRRLGVDAPVVRVGWDHEAMAVPDDPQTLGWFSPSAHRTDVVGVSLIAGHVADVSDHPGALAPLGRARVGDVIEWEDRGSITRFRVVEVRRYRRADGLPPGLFKADGPHTLRLVTCANREVSPLGIHYADNLVVSAVAE